MSSDHISSEYFELIRDVLRKKPREEHERPLKKKRRRQNEKKLEPVANKQGTEAQVVVNLDSEEDNGRVIDLVSDDGNESYYGQHEVNDDHDNDDDNNDEDYESEEFEDVGEASSPLPGDVSITINVANKKLEKKKKSNVERNICSNMEKKYRRDMHCAYLACLMVHGYIINRWLNNSKMNKKLSNIIPDKVFQLLHPEKDDEMPLRSTRKLLDGLKKAMEIWQKHWKITRRYEGYTCFMRYWDELSSSSKLSKTLSKSDYIKGILKGVGNKDLAAQGFVALLRACNVNARLVMSCQPPDFTNLKLKFGKEKNVSYEDMTKYPLFWCEVWDKFGKKWITIDPICLKTIEQVRYASKLEPKGVAPNKRNILRYVVGFDRKEGCRDITRRYAQYFNSKTRKRRITKYLEGEIWFDKLLQVLHKRKRTKIDDFENSYFDERNESEGMPDNMQDFKNHPYYILEKDLRQNQILKAGCKECGYLKLHNKANKVLKVYQKKDILDLKSARQWYMEGRILKTGAKSLKTITKKNFRLTEAGEEEEEERLYQFDDTELYVPPLATRSGEIQTNTYGNIEVFTPSMIPQNCCLIESPVAVKAASFIKVKFAKAVTAFKFEKGRNVKPSITGVVVALWYRDAVVEAINGILQAQEEEKAEEHELEALREWHTLLTKLRIKKKLTREYGKVDDEVSGPVILQQRIRNRFDDVQEEHDESTPTAGFLLSDIKNSEIKDSDSDSRSTETVKGFLPVKDGELTVNGQEEFAGGFLPQKNVDENNPGESLLIEENDHSLKEAELDDSISQKYHDNRIEEADTVARDIEDTEDLLDEDYKDFLNELNMSDEE